MATIATKGYPASARKMIKKYGSVPIQSLVIGRAPIAAFLDKTIDFLSRYTWSDLKKKYGYEKFFHLFIILHLEGGFSLVVEKNASISITRNEGRENRPEVNLFPVSNYIENSETLSSLLDKTQELMGGLFFYYEALPNGDRQFANNCQNFILSIIKALGLTTEENTKFIYQPINELAQGLPDFVRRIQKRITDLGGVVEGAIGETQAAVGLKKGGIVGRNPLVWEHYQKRI